MFIHSEFINLTNRSSKAFWFLMNGSTHPTSANWNARTLLCNREKYQRALVAWAKANHGNGKIDFIQERALGHLAYLDRILWRIFHHGAGPLKLNRVCNAKIDIINGEKIWHCKVHKQKVLCRKAYEDWLARYNY